MGKKARIREMLATMSPEEQDAYWEQRRKEKEAEKELEARLRGEDLPDEPKTTGHDVEVVHLRTLNKEEKQRIREDLKLQAQVQKLSTGAVVKKLSRFAIPQWKPISFGLVLLILKTAMELAKPLPLAYSIDTVVNSTTVSSVAMGTIILAGVFVVLISFSEGALNYLNTLVVTKAARTMTRDIRAAMFDHVQKLSLQFHSRRRSGDLLMRISADVASLQSVFTNNLIEILNSAIFLIGMALILLYIDWQIGLLTVALALPLYVFIRRYSTDIRNFTYAQRQREGSLASLFHEALGSTRLTRVFNRENQVRRQFEEESAISLELGMEASLREERFSWTVEVFGAVITGIVLVTATFKAQQGQLGINELFLIFFYARSFYRPIRTGIKNVSKVWRSMAQAERVIELLDMEHGVTDSRKARPAPPLRGEIEFRNVRFSYEEDNPLMEGVSVKIPAQRVTAVVGPTGAGKTTLVSMVPRLYDPESGQVLIDGHDIREFTLESLRDQISVVLQESTLLYGTVADNIAYGRSGADFSEIESAAWQAGAHDFIMELPKGYATVIGERGETLSGGQKQLLAISRGIIRDAPIVILDEPMTGLDPASSAQVREGLERLMQSKTVLFITHNLALVESADYVLVVNDGQVVQQGTPAELRESDGLFQELFKAQAETDSVFVTNR